MWGSLISLIFKTHVYGCFASMFVSVYHLSAWCQQRLEKESDLMELELQVVMNDHVDTRSQTQVCWESSQYCYWAISQFHVEFIHNIINKFLRYIFWGSAYTPFLQILVIVLSTHPSTNLSTVITKWSVPGDFSTLFFPYTLTNRLLQGRPTHFPLDG